jgi:hypothetical protein
VSLNHVEAFKQSLVPEDHQEALVINTIYDQLAERGIAQATRLQQAIAAADAALAPQLPHGEEFGYEAANGALRWWRFRQAYLDDLEPIYASLDETGNAQQHGLNPKYLSYMDKLTKYEEDQAFSERCLAAGDPYYIHTYAAAEKERLRREMGEKDLIDPFELEYHYALRTLRTTLDRVLDSTAATGPPQERQYLSASKNQADNYSVVRTVASEQITYIIKHFNDEPEHVLVTAQPSESIPLATHTLSCHKQGITLEGESIWDEPGIDTFQVLTLAESVAASQV